MLSPSNVFMIRMTAVVSHFWLVFLNVRLNLTEAYEGMILKGFEDHHIHF